MVGYIVCAITNRAAVNGKTTEKIQKRSDTDIEPIYFHIDPLETVRRNAIR